MAPYSLVHYFWVQYFLHYLRALVKSNALHRGQCAIWKATPDSLSMHPLLIETSGVAPDESAHRSMLIAESLFSAHPVGYDLTLSMGS